MRSVDRIGSDIALIQEKIEHLEAQLAERKLALSAAIRRANEPALSGIPEESAAILRQAADFGFFLVPTTKLLEMG